jgi:murein DD-endopeptidase MepM/ murein hydrolase activator NlpD
MSDAAAKPEKAGVPVAGLTNIGGQHPTEGLAGYPAHDYFAPAGSKVVAPVTGKVIKLSGHDPRRGPIEGPHGPLGWSVYIQGTDGHVYYLTHMGSRNVRVGEVVKSGTPIGTVADYARYGTPSHIHMGVH